VASALAGHTGVPGPRRLSSGHQPGGDAARRHRAPPCADAVPVLSDTQQELVRAVHRLEGPGSSSRRRRRRKGNGLLCDDRVDGGSHHLDSFLRGRNVSYTL